jgi:hypothetical protein
MFLLTEIKWRNKFCLLKPKNLIIFHQVVDQCSFEQYRVGIAVFHQNGKDFQLVAEHIPRPLAGFAGKVTGESEVLGKTFMFNCCFL